MITDPNRAAVLSRLRTIFCMFVFVAAGIAVGGVIRSSLGITKRVEKSPRRPFQLKIAPWVTEHTAQGQQQAEFFVVLTDQADLSGATALPTKAEKGRYVYNALRNDSEITQTPMLQWLRQRGIEHRSLYIVNTILVKGSREVAEALAARQDVARMEGNPHIRNVFPQPSAIVEASSQPRKPETIEPNISYTHAPDVWALGFRGQGITSAAQILANTGRIMRLSRTIAAGTESRLITITSGTMPFTTALEIPAATIRLSLAMTRD